MNLVVSMRVVRLNRSLVRLAGLRRRRLVALLSMTRRLNVRIGRWIGVFLGSVLLTVLLFGAVVGCLLRVLVVLRRCGLVLMLGGLVTVALIFTFLLRRIRLRSVLLWRRYWRLRRVRSVRRCVTVFVLSRIIRLIRRWSLRLVIRMRNLIIRRVRICSARLRLSRLSLIRRVTLTVVDDWCTVFGCEFLEWFVFVFG